MISQIMDVVVDAANRLSMVILILCPSLGVRFSKYNNATVRAASNSIDITS